MAIDNHRGYPYTAEVGSHGGDNPGRNKPDWSWNGLLFGEPARQSPSYGPGVRGVHPRNTIDGGPRGAAGLFFGLGEGVRDTTRDTVSDLRDPAPGPVPKRKQKGAARQATAPARRQEPETPPRSWTAPAPGSTPAAPESRPWIEKQQAGRFGEKVVSFFERSRENRAGQRPPAPHEKTLGERTAEYLKREGRF